jgi:predicted 2-oxoglutarate/Fe(II)-dependent dioxygenase YbiX
MLKTPHLFNQGLHVTTFPLPEMVKNAVEKEDWPSLDRQMQRLTSSEGELYKFLQVYHDFKDIEFIISLRDANNEWEEDGIWHDDGSRVFAFSLSLTFQPENIEGGRLGIRTKNQDSYSEIKTPPFGTIILFLTGVYGYEHKIHKVTKGRRLIIAGWCS